jgi:aspartate/methionine/tyrosine aminotransferase
MSFAVNPAISRIEAPPIAEAQTWIRPGERNRMLLNFCQAVPRYPAADALQAEVARLALDPSVSFYTDIFGLPELRDGLARHMAADYAGDVKAEDVAITMGCNQAFSAALMAIAAKGDNVIIPSPYFFNHQMWFDMLGLEARYIPAFTANGPYPRAADAAPLIDGNTRVIVLCSPNNPTGAIYPPSLIGDFFELARSRSIALVIDETYKDFRDDLSPAHHLFARPGWRDTFIQLFSFSKTFAMTGYRAGSIIAGPMVLTEIEKILDCLGICAPHISQRAALFALTGVEDWKQEKRAAMAARTAAIREAFNTPGLRYRLVSSGANFAYVEHPFTDKPAKSVAIRLASEHDLLCLPGSMFGPGQERYLRIAFANAEAEHMPLVAERLIESQG